MSESQTYYQDYRYQGAGAPPPRRRVWPWVLLGCGVVLVGLLVWALAFAEPQPVGVGPGTAAEAYAVYDEPFIAVLYAEGTMSVTESVGLYSDDSYHHQYLLDTIDELIMDDWNRGLLLYVDSPGGEVLAASELGEKLAEYKELTGRPIYAYGYSYAASGGYWIAAPADAIYLNRYCLTGSIGVTYGTMLDVSGLLERYGVTTTTITSGDQKSMGSSFEPMSEETRAIFQAMIDEYYGYFLDWVSSQRGISIDALRPLADGRIYTATQAVDNGLADAIGDMDDCLAALQAAIGEDCAVYDYTPHIDSESLFDLLRLFNRSAEANEVEAILKLAPPSGILAYYEQ